MKTEEKILMEGIESGKYENITSNTEVDISLPFYQDIIKYAIDIKNRFISTIIKPTEKYIIVFKDGSYIVCENDLQAVEQRNNSDFLTEIRILKNNILLIKKK